MAKWTSRKVRLRHGGKVDSWLRRVVATNRRHYGQVTKREKLRLLGIRRETKRDYC